MKEAVTFYGNIHKKFLWLHCIFVFLLVITSLYWFIVPYFIVQYGNFHANLFVQILLAIFLCISPTIFTTLHCWFISIYAAKKWTKVGDSIAKWTIVFQSFAMTISIIFTVVILSLFVLIDFVRIHIL